MMHDVKFVGSTTSDKTSSTETEDNGLLFVRPVEGLGTLEAAEVLVATILLAFHRSIVTMQTIALSSKSFSITSWNLQSIMCFEHAVPAEGVGLIIEGIATVTKPIMFSVHTSAKPEACIDGLSGISVAPTTPVSCSKMMKVRAVAARPEVAVVASY